MSEVLVQEPTQAQALSTTPAQLLSIAVANNADIEKLERLMDLQQRWEENEAKKQFNTAMSKFQTSIPEIRKTKQGHNGKYADIDDIAQAIKPVIEEVGLSYRFSQIQNESYITVTCVVTHVSGHQVEADMTAAADGSGGKNDIQAIASTVTYLRRYTLTAALGITTGLDDQDGGRPKISVDELLQYNGLVREEFASIAAIKSALASNEYSVAKEACMEVDQDAMRTLWKAPTKGGVFTTKERDQMKSNEWSAA